MIAEGDTLSQWEKLIAGILERDANLRFDELYKALVKMGYTPTQPQGGGSHYTFRKAGCMPVTLPKHGPIKKAYINLVADAVRSYLEEKQDG